MEIGLSKTLLCVIARFGRDANDGPRQLCDFAQTPASAPYQKETEWRVRRRKSFSGHRRNTTTNERNADLVPMFIKNAVSVLSYADTRCRAIRWPTNSAHSSRRIEKISSLPKPDARLTFRDRDERSGQLWQGQRDLENDTHLNPLYLRN